MKMCMWCCGCDIGGAWIWEGFGGLTEPNLAGYAKWELESVQSRSFIRFYSEFYRGLSEFGTDMSEVAE